MITHLQKKRKCFFDDICFIFLLCFHEICFFKPVVVKSVSAELFWMIRTFRPSCWVSWQMCLRAQPFWFAARRGKPQCKAGNDQAHRSLPAASHLLHQGLLVLDELRGSRVRSVHQLAHLPVDELGRGLAVRLLHHHLALPRQVKRHLAHLLTHPKLHHLEVKTGSAPG